MTAPMTPTDEALVAEALWQLATWCADRDPSWDEMNERVELALDAIRPLLSQPPSGGWDDAAILAALRPFTFPAHPEKFQSTDGGCTEVVIEDADVQHARSVFSSSGPQVPDDGGEDNPASPGGLSSPPPYAGWDDAAVERAIRAYKAELFRFRTSKRESPTETVLYAAGDEESAMRAALNAAAPREDAK